MVAVSKNTKKFQRKHMDAALKQRKKLKPMKNALRRKAAAFQAQDQDEQETGAEEEKQGNKKRPRSEVSQHKSHLETLKDKDPEFYKFLQDHDKELLDFDDEDDEEDEEDVEPELEDTEADGSPGKDDGSPLTLTTAIVEEWCVAVRDKHHIGALRNLLQAFRTACHYGDGEDSAKLSFKYTITNSNVFNKIMVFVLTEMDGASRRMLTLPGWGEKKDRGNSFSTADLQKNKAWKKTEPFMKTYFGNCLHILNQMTDNEMIIFILRRLKVSVVFLGAFPKLARRFLKVVLHFFCRGDEVLPVTAMVFIQEMAQLGEGMLEAVLKGIYKEYVVNAKFVNPASLPRIQFRAGCVVGLFGIDFSTSYQLAFVFIQQLAIMLRNAISMKTKDAFKRVYCWQYVNSLRLWVKVICHYPGDDELRPLLYPLAQIIGGVAQLAPTVRYFPLRLQCAKMLNELAKSTGAFIPVAALLLDMLQYKELYMKATGGVGKAIDFDTTLKVPKPAIKTRELQDGCVATVLEQLCDHLGQWSYAIAFPELAVIPLLQLRQLLKKTTVDRARRQVKQLVEQIEKNVQFVGVKRDRVSLSLQNAIAASSFLQTERETGTSPLAKYARVLKERGEQRSSYIIKEIKEGRGFTKDNEDSSSDEEQEDAENADLGGEDDEEVRPKKKKQKGKSVEKITEKLAKEMIVGQDSDGEDEADIVQDLVLSSDDDDVDDDDDMSDEVVEEVKPRKKKQKGKSLAGEDVDKVKLKKKKQEGKSLAENDVQEVKLKKKKHKGKSLGQVKAK